MEEVRGAAADITHKPLRQDTCSISHLPEAPDTPAQSPVEEEQERQESHTITDTLQTSTKTTRTQQKQQQEEVQPADSATIRWQEEETIHTSIHPSIYPPIHPGSLPPPSVSSFSHGPSVINFFSNSCRPSPT